MRRCQWPACVARRAASAAISLRLSPRVISPERSSRLAAFRASRRDPRMRLGNEPLRRWPAVPCASRPSWSSPCLARASRVLQTGTLSNFSRARPSSMISPSASWARASRSPLTRTPLPAVPLTSVMTNVFVGSLLYHRVIAVNGRIGEADVVVLVPADANRLTGERQACRRRRPASVSQAWCAQRGEAALGRTSPDASAAAARSCAARLAALPRSRRAAACRAKDRIAAAGKTSRRGQDENQRRRTR